MSKRFNFKRLWNDPEYQRWLKEDRPIIQAQLAETKTLMANQPDYERKKNGLTPVQLLALRDRVAKCKSVDKAVETINKAIFGDNGDVDAIDTKPVINDYRLDYAVTNFS